MIVAASVLEIKIADLLPDIIKKYVGEYQSDRNRRTKKQVTNDVASYQENGGPFTLLQLKVIQEVITLVVFTVFTLVFFKNEALKWNHFVGFVFLVLAVYFIRK